MNLLAAYHDSLSVVNTSQNLDLMQVTKNDSDDLPCLTSFGQNIGGVPKTKELFQRIVQRIAFCYLLSCSQACREVLGHDPGTLFGGARDHGFDGYADT